MKLADYEAGINEVLSGKVIGSAEALMVRLGIIRHEMSGIAWANRAIKAEASEILQRCEESIEALVRTGRCNQHHHEVAAFAEHLATK